MGGGVPLALPPILIQEINFIKMTDLKIYIHLKNKPGCVISTPLIKYSDIDKTISEEEFNESRNELIMRTIINNLNTEKISISDVWMIRFLET